MNADSHQEKYEDEAMKRRNYFFEIYEGGKSPTPWYLIWYDKKHLSRKDWIQETLSDILSEDKVLLDLGCSTGYFTIMNAKKAKRTIGIDISEEYLKYARKNAETYKVQNCNFLRSDIDSLNLEENIDIILFTQVLEHIEDDLSTLSKLKDLGDTLVISVPGMMPFAEKVRKSIWPETDPSGHYRNYTVESFRETIEKSGWRVRKIEEIAKGPLSFNWIIGAVCENPNR